MMLRNNNHLSKVNLTLLIVFWEMTVSTNLTITFFNDDNRVSIETECQLCRKLRFG